MCNRVKMIDFDENISPETNRIPKEFGEEKMYLIKTVKMMLRKLWVYK